MCFLRGNILNLLQLGTQPQLCVCNGYGFTVHRFLGHEIPEMRGLETLSLMWVGGSDIWLMEELWVEIRSFTCQLRRVRWHGAHYMTMR
jgi:hypothetical protein